MDKAVLTQAVAAGSSIAELARQFSVAKATIRYWMKKFELKTVRLPRQRYALAGPKHCRVCGKADTAKWLCPGCNTKVRRFRQKTRAVALLGGKCNRCGWDKHLAGLEFHHTNGSTKEITIGQVANKSWAVIKRELAKCELLCSCCHRIEHSNSEGPDFLAAVARYQGAGLE